MAKAMMNYDPNMVHCGRITKQTVRLTFGQWKARCVKEVVVGGNCTGLTVIETAIESLYDKLPDKTLVMEDLDDTLECSDDEDRGEEWLKDMLVAAEIISIEPYERK